MGKWLAKSCAVAALLVCAPAAQGQAVYGPSDIAPAVATADPDAAVSAARDHACVHRWRSRAYLAHAADVASTIAAIETGKGREVNPLVTIPFGHHPRPHEVILAKLVLVGGLELINRPLLRRGDYAGVCRAYRTQTIITAGVAALNMRVHF